MSPRTKELLWLVRRQLEPTIAALDAEVALDLFASDSDDAIALDTVRAAIVIVLEIVNRAEGAR